MRPGWLTADEVAEMMREECVSLGCTCSPEITVEMLEDGRFAHANAAHSSECPASRTKATVIVGPEATDTEPVRV